MRSVKLGFVAVAMLLGSTALTTPAFATGNHCTKNCNPTPPPPPKGGDIDIDNKNTAIGVGIGYGEGGNGYGGHGYGGQGGKGGEGGQGGRGGDADATAINHNANIAKGGDAHAYNKNDIDIDNKNINKNDIDINNKNYNTNLNANKNVNKNENNNTNKQAQGQIQGQAQGQHQSSYNANDNSNSNNANLEVNTYNERAPVNTAYAAPLAVGEDTCMGSSSIGAQAVSFGLSIGTTWQDDNCRRLKNSRQLVSLGYHRAATSLMCVDEDVRQAMIMAGTPCPNGEVVAVFAPPPAREYTPMAPVVDRPVRKVRKVRKALPPK
ncbi:MAG: hypothetical protein HOP13_07610 [Alphaproteobacteria bacterium]|nr:hypothetical protein [Alphaproteobacteria bacterium]